MTDESGEETLQIELSGRRLERWEQLRERWTEPGAPEPTDELLVDGLLDTIDGVREGIYGSEATDRTECWNCGYQRPTWEACPECGEFGKGSE